MVALVELVTEMEVDNGRLEEYVLNGDDEGVEWVEDIGGIFSA